MTWRDNLRAASSEDGFIIAGGSGASMIPQNTNWHDNYMNSFTEEGIKIANLKDAVSQVETLPQEADTGSLYYLTTGANPGMYYYDGTQWVAVGGGGGGVTPEQLDARVKQMAGTPTTSTIGTVGQLIEDTTNGLLYQCTTIRSDSEVDTSAGLTSQVTNVTFTLSSASTFNSVMATLSLPAGNYYIRKGTGLSFFVSTTSSDASLGTLTGINGYNFSSNLGVSPDPVAVWNAAVGALANKAVVLSFTMKSTGVSYIWDKVNPTVVQTTGNSETSVMSQKAITDTLFYNNSTNKIIITPYDSGQNPGTYSAALNGTIANGATYSFSTAGGRAYASYSINMGQYATSSGEYGISIGASSSANGTRSIALGNFANTNNYDNSVALGSNSGNNITNVGMVDVGSSNTGGGYNGNSNYRVITGVHDAQGDHDAVTLGQLNTLITNLNQALGTAIPLLGNANNANNNSGSAQTVTCPFCGQETDATSTICQNCGSDMTSTPYDPGTGEEPGPEDPGVEPVDPGDNSEPGPEDAEAPMEG